MSILAAGAMRLRVFGRLLVVLLRREFEHTDRILDATASSVNLYAQAVECLIATAEKQNIACKKSSPGLLLISDAAQLLRQAQVCLTHPAGRLAPFDRQYSAIRYLHWANILVSLAALQFRKGVSESDVKESFNRESLHEVGIPFEQIFKQALETGADATYNRQQADEICIAERSLFAVVYYIFVIDPEKWATDVLTAAREWNQRAIKHMDDIIHGLPTDNIERSIAQSCLKSSGFRRDIFDRLNTVSHAWSDANESLKSLQNCPVFHRWDRGYNPGLIPAGSSWATIDIDRPGIVKIVGSASWVRRCHEHLPSDLKVRQFIGPAWRFEETRIESDLTEALTPSELKFLDVLIVSDQHHEAVSKLTAAADKRAPLIIMTSRSARWSREESGTVRAPLADLDCVALNCCAMLHQYRIDETTPLLPSLIQQMRVEAIRDLVCHAIDCAKHHWLVQRPAAWSENRLAGAEQLKEWVIRLKDAAAIADSTTRDTSVDELTDLISWLFSDDRPRPEIDAFEVLHLRNGKSVVRDVIFRLLEDAAELLPRTNSPIESRHWIRWHGLTRQSIESTLNITFSSLPPQVEIS